MADNGDITKLLADARGGDRACEQRLMELVYSELHRLATGYMRKERRDHTLQPSALVNEAYLRLVGDQKVAWESRAHFYVAAARTMRRVLIDHARAHTAGKRGAGAHKVSLHDAAAAMDADAVQMLSLETALHRLADLDPRQAEIVELRFFGGLTVEETANVLRISPKTVKRDWAVARAWLEAELHG
ncbi:MAG: sigma-70 family RNA polymerase sigma factor [Bryobacteraceae bacterium]